MSYIASDHVHPEWKVWDNFISDQQDVALHVDALQNTHPIEVEVNHPREIDELFDDISYHKGCSILDMLSHYINAENFRLGTSDYLKAHAHGNATTQDLLKAYEERSGLPVREVMSSWLFNPGHPVIVVTDAGDHFELSQERFFLSERSRRESNDITIWQIPLVMHTEGTDPTSHLMKDRTMRFSKQEGRWLLVNEGANSFARVDYPQSILDSLKEPISQQLIAPADRFALVRDVFDLAQGGISSVEKALSFVDSYRNETNFAVWSVIAEKLANVSNIIDGEDPEVREQFNTFARSIFGPVAEKLGWEKKPGESDRDIFLRELALYNLGKFGDRETIRIAHEKFEAHLGGVSPLDPDLRNAVYKIVAANGGEREYNQLMDLYKNSTLQEERVRILSALGGFTDPSLTERSLQFALFGDGKESEPKADAYRLIASLFSNPDARERAWEFTKGNWDRILELYGESQLLLRRFISPATQFHSLKHAQDAEEFFATHDTPGAERMVQQVVELITSKADWLERDRSAIVSFLGKRVGQNQAA